MPGKDHGPSIKDDERYEALRREGASKEKAARIANAGDDASEEGGKAGKYEERTKEDLSSGKPPRSASKATQT